MKRKGYNLEDAVALIFRYWLGDHKPEDKEAYEEMLRATGVSYGEKDIKEALEVLRGGDAKADERRTKAYQKFLRHTRRGRLRKELYPRLYAAVAVLILGIGIALLHIRQDTRVPERQGAEELIVLSKAYLTLSDGERVDLSQTEESICLENEDIVSCDSGRLVYKLKENRIRENPGKEKYNRITVPRGGDFKLLLSDGSQVWLNSESELKYPVEFKGEKREVYMSGEAYFDVAHQGGQPFVVHTSRGKIEVLGTEFNVRDYKEEKTVETTLVEGTVVYHSTCGGNKGVTLPLQPGYQSVDGDGNLVRRKVDVENVVGWKSGKFCFYDKSLEELMRYVERTYDVHVFFTNEDVKHLRFSGDLQRYVRVELFLRYLENGGDVHFDVQGRSIIVYKK